MRHTWWPGTHAETHLVSEMAATRWRIRRVARMEQAANEAASLRSGSAPDSADLTQEQLISRAINDVTNGPEMKQVHRHETRLRRAFEKATAELETLISNRVKDERDAEGRDFSARTLAEAKAQLKLAQQRPVQNEPTARDETTAAWAA